MKAKEDRCFVVVKISQTDFNDGCTILWKSKYLCYFVSAFIACLLQNVSFMGVGLKTLSGSLLIPESIEYVEYILDPQKQMLDTLSCMLSHFVSNSLWPHGL